MVDYKGGACQTCGYNLCINALTFHHIDPTTKKFSISDRKNSSFDQELKEELDKCICLCRRCHMELHDQMDLENSAMNVPIWEARSLKGNQITEEVEIKTCTMCSLSYFIDDFYFRDGKTGKVSRCKRCHGANKGILADKYKQEGVDYKGSKCVICSYDKCNRALDFHHTDPSKKDFAISKFRYQSFNSVKPELDKCILLCCRCHVEVHSGLHTESIISVSEIEG